MYMYIYIVALYHSCLQFHLELHNYRESHKLAGQKTDGRDSIIIIIILQRANLDHDDDRETES